MQNKVIYPLLNDYQHTLSKTFQNLLVVPLAEAFFD